jgi:hypothetical protein
MTDSQNGDVTNPKSLTFNPPLFRTESKEEFEKLFDELKGYVQPANFVESMYVHEIAVLAWDIMRYRRAKAGIVDNALRQALEDVLRPFLGGPDDHLGRLGAARALAFQWFWMQAAKDKVSALLKEVDLDERVIEAEALRSRLSEIEKLDRLIASAEARRDDAFRTVACYKQEFSEKLQQNSNRILDADEVARIPSLLNS